MGRRQITVGLVSFVMVVSAFLVPFAGMSVYAGAAGTDVLSGSCGATEDDHVEWTLIDNTLTISGTGDMCDYGGGEYAPWQDYTYFSVIINEGVTKIGNCAFSDSYISFVDIPESVETIGNSAFSDTTYLSFVKGMKGLKEIGEGAFAYSGIEAIILPEGLETIGRSAFNRSQLKSIAIPEGIETIEASMFGSCSTLQEITLPASLKTINQMAFNIPNGTINKIFYKGTQEQWAAITIGQYNRALETAVSMGRIQYNTGDTYYCGDNLQWEVNSDGELIIKGEGGMTNYTSDSGNNPAPWILMRSIIKSIRIKEHVTSVGTYAFYGCNKAKEIYFEGNAPSFGEPCFSRVTATAYYPENDPTWTEDVRQNYGGTITWVPWTPSAPSGSVSIQSLMPQNGEQYVIPELFTSNKICVEFSERVDVTGTGSADLHDYETDEIVDTIPLTEENKDKGYFCVGKTIRFHFSKTVEKGHKYYITINEGALKFIDQLTLEDLNITFPGIYKGEWCFTIIGFEIPSFTNQAVNIDLALYSCMFAPIYSAIVRLADDGSRGICYGMGYTAKAWQQQWRGVAAATRSFSIEETPIEADYNTGLSYLEYIEWVHLSQYMPSVAVECSFNTNLQKVYNAVRAAINGTGSPIMLGLQGDPEGRGHAVLPVAILSDTEDKAEIMIYDSNKPWDARTDTKTFYPTLTFTKTNNTVTGFEYLSYTKLNYNTFDNSADEGAYFFHAFEDTTYRMVTSSMELVGSVQDLFPIIPRNGSNNSNVFLYWTEASSITTNQSDSVSISDGYKRIAVNANDNSEITVNIDDNSAVITALNGETGNYTITYSSADTNSSGSSSVPIESIEISGISDSVISSQQTDEGILISAPNGESLDSISVNADVNSMTVNTAECESSEESVLITFGDAISVKEDTDKDGDYETEITYSENDTIAYGTFDNGILWILYKDGTMVVSGEGDIPSFESADATPWSEYRESIRKITVSDGITTIGNYAFYGCENLSSVEIPGTVTEIGDYAFYNCENLSGVLIPESVESIGNQVFDGFQGVIKVYSGSYAEAYCIEKELTYIVICSDHIWNEEYLVDKEATCTEEGSESIHCSVCGVIDETTIRTIPKKDHDYGEWTVTIEATCTEDGSREKVCTNCGDKVTETIPAVGHIWNDYYTTDVEPTATEEGSESIHCSVCDATNESTIRPIHALKGTWKQDRNGWWYLWEDGTYPKNKFEIIEGVTYYFNPSGYMVTGWQSIDGKWYYFNASGAMMIGWQKLGGVWYYMNSNGAMVIGWQSIGGVWYYFNNSGAMQTGWRQLGGVWYYMNASGAMVTGWQSIGGKWYYFNAGGAMMTGWQQIGDVWYYMNSSGAMVTGWLKLGNTWYYMNASGAMVTGRQQIDGTWYTFSSSGAMQ